MEKTSPQKQVKINFTKTLVDKALLEEILTVLEKNNRNGEYNILIGKIKLHV